MDEAVLLIAERSGRWESYARAWLEPGHQLILLPQPEGESPRAFLRRVRDRLAHIRARDVHLRRVILVAGTEASNGARTARARLLSVVQLEFLDQNVELMQVKW